jgi:hypothetical protein
MSSTIVARIAETKQPLRNWIAIAVPYGQVVYKGRYHFAWSRGRFIGAYDSLDDAVESLAFRERGIQNSHERRTARANDAN